MRPITLIAIFRKVFERLLHSQFNDDGWARVHPLQAGFRRDHSPLLNAAVLHSLLESGYVTHVAFLDFKAAFDVVDHGILRSILLERGCPRKVLSLLTSLMFDGISSYIVAGSEISKPFARTRGVLQGSPLSLHLFSIFIDSLLSELESTGSRPVVGTTLPVLDAGTLVPTLFYADDGTLLATSEAGIQALLDVVGRWCIAHGIDLNMAKCGSFAPKSQPSFVPLVLGLPVPRKDSYKYLGFPFTPEGIDFAEHLTSSLRKARKKSDFLKIFSDSWEPTHRLQVYKTYLAPMFEWSAPLVATHATLVATRARARETKEKKKKGGFFEGAAIEDEVKELQRWIVGSKGSSHLTRYFLGLRGIADRFADLKTQFHSTLVALPEQCALRRLKELSWRGTSFYKCFILDERFEEMKYHALEDPNIGLVRLKWYVRNQLRTLVRPKPGRETTWRLAQFIPDSSHLDGTFSGGDIVLSAPRRFQADLLRYRRGVFKTSSVCCCRIGLPRHKFRRGHERHMQLPLQYMLSTKELVLKDWIVRSLGPDALFTDVDFLINRGCFARAYSILRHIARVLVVAAEARSGT